MVILTEGKKILALSTGSVTSEALKAVKEVNKKKNIVRLINLHTLKPLDKNLIKHLRSFDKIITIEEHSIIGVFILRYVI